MNKKAIGLSVIIAIVSSIATVLLIKFLDKPKEIVMTEDGSAQFASYSDALFSGRLQRRFLASSPNNFTAAAATVTPAVANIKALQSTESSVWGDESFTASNGSGVIISPDGYIVTNNHVIENSNDIEVTLNDRRRYNAKLIGTDPSTDLALLKINTENRLPYVFFGNSDSLRVGEWVLAVGNPFNLESTVTAGIVSAKGRKIDILQNAYSIESFIQTDAAVNPGNSGGALVNTNGELVGINTAIITKSGRYEGYSFAVPANLAQKVIKDLKEFGVVQRGFLGLNIGELNDDSAKELGLNNLNGVLVTSVNRGGGAEEAGLQRDDVLVAINGAKIKSMPELQEQVGKYRPGNSVIVDYIRSGKSYKTNVVLRNNRQTTNLTTESKILKDLGFELRELNKDESRRLRVSGVRVVSITRASKIARTNMILGYIITRVNDREVNNVEEVIKEVEKANEKIVLEGFYEDNPNIFYYTFTK